MEMIVYDLGWGLMDLDENLDENGRRQKLGIPDSVYSVDRWTFRDQQRTQQNPNLGVTYQAVYNPCVLSRPKDLSKSTKNTISSNLDMIDRTLLACVIGRPFQVYKTPPREFSISAN